MDLIRKVALRFCVDPDKTYVTDISMGRAKTWHLSQNCLTRFAAIATETRHPSQVSNKYPLIAVLVTAPVYHME